MTFSDNNKGFNKPIDPQCNPKDLAEAIFLAAQSGNYKCLASFIDADADNDCKRIVLAVSDSGTSKQFQKYFSKGKVIAEPIVNGDKAYINILFGPDGTQEETFELVRKDNKWYLHSF